MPDLADQGEEPLSVVALVGSAGAHATIIDLLGRLPEDFPAAIVALLHQAPEHVGQLDSVLARRSRLKVRYAERSEELASGHVVVVPPGYHMVIAPGAQSRLVTSGAFPPHRPSADLLLSTMGVSLGKCAIAVVLSGSGKDAATGATVVHELDGTVIAVDPEHTPHPSMPVETIERDEAVDYVVAPPDIAALLVKLTEKGRMGLDPNAEF